MPQRRNGEMEKNERKRRLSVIMIEDYKSGSSR